jgi:4-hydroxyphenylpyruvate dioxygenase
MLEIDYIHFYVDNAQKWRDWFVSVLGFQSLGNTTDNHTQTEVIFYPTSLLFLLSSPLNSLSPAFLDKWY